MRPLSSFSTKTEPQNTNAQKEKIVRQETDITGYTDAPKPSDYLDDLKAEEGFEDITEAQALEYLQSLFDIMSGFVSIGYGLEPVQKLIKDFENTANGKRILISCKDAKDEQ